MPDDPGVGEQTVDVVLVERRDRDRIETGERRSEVLTLAEDRQPRQARLEPFEAELLEQPVVVGDAETPLGVVVRDVLGRRRAPPAPQLAVVTLDEVHRVSCPALGRMAAIAVGIRCADLGEDQTIDPARSISSRAGCCASRRSSSHHS